LSWQDIGVTLLDDVRALGPRIRELAPAVEADRRLAPELAQRFADIGVWGACAPASIGGLELPLADVITMIEELSYGDGSVGWNGMIGGTSGVVYAYLDERVAKELYSPGRCICGVIAPSGRSTPTEGGFRVSGRWSFGSGVDNADYMALGTIIDSEGTPSLRTVVAKRGEFEIVDNWDVSGLRGTGSNDVVMEDVFIPDERTCVFDKPLNTGPLYAFPFFGFLALGVASVCLGIARSAIDELRELASAKVPTGGRRPLARRPAAQVEVAKATAELLSARAFVDAAVAQAWDTAQMVAEPSIDERVKLRLAATHAARTSAKVVDRMYEAGGASSIYAKSKLQRNFRDVHAATQHLVVSPATYELMGRLLLGVETEVGQL
jgi:alkylation response protein AidB-like acyl-CoA dehydrogenase